MKQIRSKTLCILAALCISAPASAEDMALILSTTAYRNQPDLPSRTAVERISAALAGAGFATVTFRNQPPSAISGRLSALAPRIADADRLVIVANGHIAHTTREIWHLGPDTTRPTGFNVGATALPLGPLIDMAGEKPGAVALVLIDHPAATNLGAGLTTGPGDMALPQGVMALIGRAGPTAAFVETVLTQPGQPIAPALARTDDVRGIGFVPAQGGFLPPTLRESEPEVSIAIVEPEEPAPSPEEILANIERDLGLSRADRRRVQQSLAILGHDPGGIDGLIGRGTRRALRSWQTAENFDPTGYLNRGQHQLLLAQGKTEAERLEAEAKRKQAEEDARDRAFWRDMGSGESEVGMRAYLDRHPDGLFSEEARDRLAEIEEARRPPVSAREQRDWNRVTDADTPQAYRSYLDAYPQGAFRTEAQFRLDELEASEFSESEIRNFEAEERRVAGAAVTRRLVENRLAALGLEPGVTDGEFDEDTRRALRRFQEVRGLEVTGYVNQATLVRVLLGN